MRQVTLWLWFFAFCLFMSSFGMSRVLFGLNEDPSKKQVVDSDRENKIGGKVADFFLNSKSDQKPVPALEPVTVITSRLPSFRTRLSDIPANVTYIPANITIKSEEELREKNPRSYQEALHDIEGAVFYDNVGNDLDYTFSLRGFS